MTTVIHGDTPAEELLARGILPARYDMAIARIKELEATIKEWESGALVRGWRELREDREGGKK